MVTHIYDHGFTHCDHRWHPVGSEYKTYGRSDVSPDNPIRQAYRCPQCESIKTEVVRVKP